MSRDIIVFLSFLVLLGGCVKCVNEFSNAANHKEYVKKLESIRGKSMYQARNNQLPIQRNRIIKK